MANVKPSQVSLNLVGSPFKKSETEAVMRNVIVISRKNDDSWFAFTWNEYKKRCTHQVTLAERVYLDLLVKYGVLEKSNGRYVPQPAKIAEILKNYITS